MTQILMYLVLLYHSLKLCPTEGFLSQHYYLHKRTSTRTMNNGNRSFFHLKALSQKYLENDLIAVRVECSEQDVKKQSYKRLCVVKPDGAGVYPLCQHADDMETDLYVDPRESDDDWTETLVDDDVIGTYGEGWYGQRVVPSLGGGPGYGAEADHIWSVDEEILENIRNDDVEIPMLDLGIAHGEKARGGAI